MAKEVHNSIETLATFLGVKTAKKKRAKKKATKKNAEQIANNNANDFMESVGNKSCQDSSIKELAHYLLFESKEVPLGRDIKDAMEVALAVAKRRLEAQEVESSKVRTGHIGAQYWHRVGWNNNDEAPVETAPMTDADHLQAAANFMRS